MNNIVRFAPSESSRYTERLCWSLSPTESEHHVPRPCIALAGPELIEAFLGELRRYVASSPDKCIDDWPDEIVKNVVSRSDRFGTCTDGAIAGLSKQLVMAVNRKGGRYRLACRQMGGRGSVMVIIR